jgi:4-amino-4-deoxy-L-arabinose transferase-like glycosyltransferase
MQILPQISGILHDKIVLFIIINFFILLYLIVVNWRDISSYLNFDKKIWVILFGIFIIALLMRLFIPPPQHIMYTDEALYMQAAKKILQTGYQGDYRKPIGWPFIISIAFNFGISNWIAIYSSIILGALTVFNMFFLSFAITKNKGISLASSLIFSLFSSPIRWSATAETNVASMFFIILSLFLCFLYYENKKKQLLWLALAGLGFACQFRPENYIILALFLFGCFLFNKEDIFSLKFALPLILIIILILPNLIQVLDFYLSTNWIESDSQGALKGSNFGIANLLDNSLNFGGYIFKDRFQPILFSLFFVLGAGFMFLKQRKEFLFLSAWFILLWFVYFFSWFQTLGGGTILWAKTRFFMSFYPITVIFMGYGILLVREIFPKKIMQLDIRKFVVLFLVVTLSIQFIPYSIEARQMFADNIHLLETKIPELAEKDIPKECIVVANNPEILLSTTNLNVIDINYFLHSTGNQDEIFNQSNCVLFFEDMTCQSRNVTIENCKLAKEMFITQKFISYKEGEKEYIFYKLSKKE